MLTIMQATNTRAVGLRSFIFAPELQKHRCDRNDDTYMSIFTLAIMFDRGGNLGGQEQGTSIDTRDLTNGCVE